MLLARISVPPPAQPEPEDIFSSALTTIFTDDTVNSHGTPGSSVTYCSPRFGDMSLRIPVHPDVEEGRKLFAHYLWNAAVVAADAIESASTSLDEIQDEKTESKALSRWDGRYFDMRNKRVLELGAGTALPSLIAALCGAKLCTVTDHPSSPALTTGAIEKNCEANLFSLTSNQFSHSEDTNNEVSAHAPALAKVLHPPTGTSISVYGYTWGTSTFYLPSASGKPAPPLSNSHFDRIIIADCLWMPSQHINLIRTILQFLPPPNTSSSTSNIESSDTLTPPEPDSSPPCALVIAGFHTGRNVVSNFFSLATEPQPPPSQPPPSSTSTFKSAAEAPADNQPDPATANTHPLDPNTLTSSDRALCGRLHLASIHEVDVDGNTRAWQSVREGEGKWEAKRWCVVGVLVRR